MIRISEVDHLEQIYHYQMQIYAPYFFPVDYATWRESFSDDTDGEGRILFKELFVKAAYDNNKLIGFIQYGKTAFGFDNQGELSSDVSYCVIRNLYFDPDRTEAGEQLLKEALDAFSLQSKVFAFFHYFGMSCFARHGKLFERHTHIESVMKQNHFITEHENVYYTCLLQDDAASAVTVIPHDLSKGHQQCMDFLLSGNHVGGCEIHFLDKNTSYLRWIYVNEDSTGKGIGTKCMHALKSWLYHNGITRLDTDTALSNSIAQHYYEKNDFVRKGITRSYYRS